MDYDLGYIDLEEKTLQPLNNPFGPKVHAGSNGRCNTAQCFDSRMLPQAEPIYLAVLDQNQARVVFRRPYLSQRFWPLFSLQIGFEFSVASTH